MSWPQRLVGIFLGIVLGIGVVAVFVFTGSEGTIDAPLLEIGDEQQHGAGHDRTPPVATIRIIGGAPPESGPAELSYRRGDQVRLRVLSDQTVAVELTGYGITRTVSPGEPAVIEFKASRAGNFALIVAASHIAVAQLQIS